MWWGGVPKDNAPQDPSPAPAETTSSPAETAETTVLNSGTTAGEYTEPILSPDQTAALQAALEQGNGSTSGDDASGTTVPREVPRAFQSKAVVPPEERAAASQLLQQQEEASVEVLDRISFRVELFATIMENGQDKACFDMIEYLNRLQNSPAGSPPVPEIIAKALEKGVLRLSWYFVDAKGAPIRELAGEVSQALGYELEEFVTDVREELTKAAQAAAAANQSSSAAPASNTLTMAPAVLRNFLDMALPEARETFLREFLQNNGQVLMTDQNQLKMVLGALTPDQQRLFAQELGRTANVTPRS